MSRGYQCCRDDDDNDDDDDDQEHDECSDDDEDGSDEDLERQHFLDVCYSLMEYPRDAAHDMAQIQDTLGSLDPLDAELSPIDHPTFIAEMQMCINVNARFLQLLPVPDVCGKELGPEGELLVRQVPENHRVASRNSSKVRSTLRQFVRDWSMEGEAERLSSYAPLIEALMRRMHPREGTGGARGTRGPSVLCPGCGLGRLVFDLARLGYAAQGNEFSYHMLLGSYLILNRSSAARCFTIYPYVLTLANRRCTWDHVRPVQVPDVCPKDALPADAEFSMSAGEFVEVYMDQKKCWDAVLTCFFLDTAKNIFLYIRTIAYIIREGGLWINLGPLLYHYAEMPSEVSIELSWEEVQPAICKYFDIVEEEDRLSHYSCNPSGLGGVQYRCKFWVGIRNSTPVSGKSNPVF